MGRSPSPRKRRRSVSPLAQRGERPSLTKTISRDVTHHRSRYSPGFGPERSPKGKEPIRPKEAPSGRLTEQALTKNGVALKYAEPTEARLPERKWRLHVFKGDQQILVIPLHGKSCYRIGRDPLVSDILVEHESCSKQHAAIQHRELTVEQGYGAYVTANKPYLIDLESTHGTCLNGQPLESRRFVELKAMDIVRFACSTREYVVMVEDLLPPKQDPRVGR